MILITERRRFNPQLSQEEGVKYWFNEGDEKLYHESDKTGMTQGIPIRYFVPPHTPQPEHVKTREAAQIIRFARNWMKITPQHIKSSEDEQERQQKTQT